MSLVPDLRHRAAGPELMDSPDCDEALLLRTIDQFRIINPLFSRCRTILDRWILQDMLRDPGREYHLADLGAGGLDISCWLLRAAARRGLRLRVTAIELDDRVYRRALQQVPARPGLVVVRGDVLRVLPELVDVDYAFCNHFLHHLDDATIVKLLQMLGRMIRRRFVLSDLLRSGSSYLGFALFGRLFLHRSFALADGLTSIRRGFLPGELGELARRADLSVSVYPLHPGRLVVVGTVDR